MCVNRPIDPATNWAPFVTGPDNMPRVEDVEFARLHPGLAVLSALAHNRTLADVPLLRAVFDGIRTSDLELAEKGYYWGVVEATMSSEARTGLEATMEAEKRSYRNEYERLVMESFDRGIEKGIDKGIEKGRAEERQASAAAMRRMFLQAVHRRNAQLTARQAAALESCGDPATIEGWYNRLLAGAEFAALLGE